MRLAEDTKSWHAQGLMRRDARHCADGPEVCAPPRSTRRPTKYHCTSNGGLHRPAVYVTATRATLGRDEKDNQVLRYTEYLGVRCSYCKRRDLPGELLAPFGQYLTLHQRQLLLADYWCAQGHLLEAAPTQYHDYRRLRGRYRLVEVVVTEYSCLCCGLRRPPRRDPKRVTDARLYAGAGVDPTTATHMAKYETGEKRIYSRPLENSKERKLRRRKEKTTRTTTRA
jgi:hypothetical protein